MINFFESTLQPQTNDKKAKTLKYVSAGIGVLSSAGIGLKIGSVMSMFEETYQKMQNQNEIASWMKALSPNGQENFKKALNLATKYYKDGDVVKAAKLIEDNKSMWPSSITYTEKFFGNLGQMINKIPVIGSINEWLSSNINRTVAYGISTTIIGVLVVLFIIDMYYLIKFLYKKWKQRKLKKNDI